MPQKEILFSLMTVFRALRHRNFRLFFFGQSVSLIGTWMQQIAMGWLVYRLTHSPFMMGLVAFAGQVPILLVAPFTGVLADRWHDRRRIILVTQGLMMAQALLLAFLIFTGNTGVPLLMMLSLFLGVVSAFDIPARQSFLSEMVEEKEDLGNAIALHAAVFNGARLVGPVLAGLLIALGGEALCFFLNGASYVAVIAALLAMQISPRAKNREGLDLWKDFKEGLAYVWHAKPIADSLALMALAAVVGMPYMLLMPVFVRETLGGDARMLGYLVGASGCGALLGGFFMASRREVPLFPRYIAAATGTFGVVLGLFSASRSFPVACALMFVIGIAMIVQMVSTNTLVQTLVPDDKRGRVMSLYAVALLGMAPLGSLWAGSLSQRLGVPWTLALGGAICIAAAAAYWGRRSQAA